MDKNVGLVLEGGGMRGAYTSGVLAAFMDGDIRTPYVIGVSAGASNGANYVSGQRERNKKVFVDHVKDKEYSGLTHWIKKKSYFNMDFLYGELPNEVVPFDYEAFDKSKVVLKLVLPIAKRGNQFILKKAILILNIMERLYLELLVVYLLYLNL